MGGGYRLLTVGSRACLGGLVKPLECVIGPLAVPTGIHCQCLQPTLSSPTSTATNYHNCTSLAFFTLNPHLRNSLSLLSDLHQLTVTRRLLPSLVVQIVRLIVPCFEHILPTSLQPPRKPIWTTVSISLAIRQSIHCIVCPPTKGLCTLPCKSKISVLLLEVTQCYSALPRHCCVASIGVALLETCIVSHTNFRELAPLTANTKRNFVKKTATQLLSNLHCYSCCACRIQLTSCSTTSQTSDSAATISFHG